MRQVLFSVASILAVATPLAADPDSRTLARCAGLLAGVHAVVPQHGNIAVIEADTVAFQLAANVRAWSEGHDDPSAWAIRHRDAMREDWRAYGGACGGLKVFSQEFVGQLDICRGFADDHGIDMDFD